MLFIFLNMYNRSQANNILYQVLYQTFCSLFWEESVMVESTNSKL